MKWIVPMLVAAQAFACHIVEGDRILARDLAAANPSFVSLDPDLPVAATPVPGVVRVMHAAELVRLARSNGIDLPAPASEVCFARFTEPLTAEKLLPVLRKTLDVEGTTIEILDFSHAEVPRGSLEFSRNGLNPSGLWHGQVMYAPARSVPVWVKARVSVERTWVEAARPIGTGKTIDMSQVVMRTGPRFPFSPMPADSLSRVAGKAALRSIQPGEAIFDNMLTNPREVERGDTVAVVVSSGEAKLRLEATAESSGRAGETIVLRNPENGRYFQAKIEGKDQAAITK
ncbi:MAG TPA: flagellar basal body P-ring formation chaperone FlgA [Bryobacteraceae bacterium]|nr:flagellar basal body P-ring formation chaperone FlgA [Bryobacteraceae bacterium]